VHSISINRRLCARTAAVFACSLLGGCYLLQSAAGQLGIMSERKPIAGVIANPATPPEVRRQLEAVAQIRDFATRRLGLPDNGSYRSYADVDRRYVVWNVVAAPEFSVDPKEWCYPVVGCVAYRGYFVERRARRFAGELRGRGLDVTVVEMLPGLLPGADRDLVLPLHKRLEKLFDGILLNTTVAAVKDEGTGIRATLKAQDGTSQDKVFDRVLVSVGRKPNSEIPGLEKTQVKVGAKGFIEVNKQLQTADPAIYAIGDVNGEPMLAHKAMHEGRTAVEAIAGHKVAFEPAAIPAVVFTDPEVAWAGLTETQAQKENIEIKVAKFPWAASGRAVTLDRPEGMTKLLIDPQTERVLGVGIVGAGAGELIAEGVLAIEMAALAHDIAHTIHPHPTLSETVMNSAEVFFGTSTDIYRPKRG